MNWIEIRRGYEESTLRSSGIPEDTIQDLVINTKYALDFYNTDTVWVSTEIRENLVDYTIDVDPWPMLVRSTNND